MHAGSDLSRCLSTYKIGCNTSIGCKVSYGSCGEGWIKAALEYPDKKILEYFSPLTYYIFPGYPSMHIINNQSISFLQSEMMFGNVIETYRKECSSSFKIIFRCDLLACAKVKIHTLTWRNEVRTVPFGVWPSRRFRKQVADYTEYVCNQN